MPYERPIPCATKKRRGRGPRRSRRWSIAEGKAKVRLLAPKRAHRTGPGTSWLDAKSLTVSILSCWSLKDYHRNHTLDMQKEGERSDCAHGGISIEPRPPAKIRRAVTTTHEIRTAGYVGGGFHLGHEECRIATIMSYYCGRNTAPLIGKMKKLLRHPGGHNTLGSSENMTARTGGRDPVGLTFVVVIPHSASTRGNSAPRVSGGRRALACRSRLRGLSRMGLGPKDSSRSAERRHDFHGTLFLREIG